MHKLSPPINIFLPAAGLGERLRPITNHLPKPLLPILGKPLIGIVLDRITPVCTGRIGINLHWKADLIRDWAAASQFAGRVTFFPEPILLGTGGALKNAESFLTGSPFLVHNADILLDIDLKRLVETHLSNNNIATLVTHRIPRLSNVVVDERGLLLDVENPGESRPDPDRTGNKVAYTGIALYSPAFLRYLPNGISHTTSAWIAAARDGHRVESLDFTGAYWCDVGTPATYAGAVFDALQQQGETVDLSLMSQCGNVDADGFVVFESGSMARDGCRIRNCIVLPGAIAEGKHENSIIGPDYALQLTEADMQPMTRLAERKRVLRDDPLLALFFGTRNDISSVIGDLYVDANLIGLGGSDRRYYRIRNGAQAAILMECGPSDQDYERHLAYSRFFKSHALPVPKLMSVDCEKKRALFEDLGDISLYSFLKFPRTPEQIEETYRGVLDALVTLHSTITHNVQKCPMLATRFFDYEYFRWETHYFFERFVTAYCKKTIGNRNELDEEFNQLARKADAYPKVVIHRDFQSQNIMLLAGKPRIIDFQGSRMAPAAYDIASLLWDPYYRMNDDMRSRLLDYYRGEMSRENDQFKSGQFEKSLMHCRLQRHMQALGAYGFLTLEKKKVYFEKHIPEALRLLKDETAAVKNEFPVLYQLVNSLQEKKNRK